MKTNDLRECHTCKKVYDEREVKRSLGSESAPYLLGYCSAPCYTNATVELILEGIDDGE